MFPRNAPNIATNLRQTPQAIFIIIFKLRPLFFTKVFTLIAPGGPTAFRPHRVVCVQEAFRPEPGQPIRDEQHGTGLGDAGVYFIHPRLR